MEITSPEWDKAMSHAFSLGRGASSVFENPFWKECPTPASCEEKSKARHWLDGYVEKLNATA